MIRFLLGVAIGALGGFYVAVATFSTAIREPEEVTETDGGFARVRVSFPQPDGPAT